MHIDFTPIINLIFTIIAAILTPFVAWAVMKVGKLARIQMTAQQAAQLEGAIQHGIAYALGKAQEVADAHGVVPAKSQAIATAAAYIMPKVPEVLTSLGITPQGLSERIEARLVLNPATDASGAPVAASHA